MLGFIQYHYIIPLYLILLYHDIRNHNIYHATVHTVTLNTTLTHWLYSAVWFSFTAHVVPAWNCQERRCTKVLFIILKTRVYHLSLCWRSPEETSYTKIQNQEVQIRWLAYAANVQSSHWRKCPNHAPFQSYSLNTFELSHRIERHWRNS